MKTSTVGSVASSAPAVINGQSVTYWPWSVARPAVTGRSESDCSRISAHRKSLKTQVNSNVASAASEGRLSGSITCQ